MTKIDFARYARPVRLTLRGQDVLIKPARLPAGAMGWREAGTIVETIAGTPFQCRYTVVITVVGSKTWPQDVAPPSNWVI